ncbi:MAG: calcium-binding protein, partial [Rivularia sp. (in: cyanobacteria)]
MASDNEFLNFLEQIVFESIEITEVNGIEGTNSIGEGPSFISNWYAAGTNLLDDEPDEVLATKTAGYKVIAQLGNGEFVGEIEETIQFVNGSEAGNKIFTQGFLEPTLAPSGGTTTLQIVGGTGSFKNIRGLESVTGIPSIPGALDVSLEKFKQIQGSRKSDKINGKNINEFIAGNNGNDTIKGGQGNDIIEGGRGGDIIRGGAGNDILAADRVNRFQDFDGTKSELRGDNGDDIIYGGSKGDLIGGGNGDDLLFGKSGDDLIRGGGGFDLLQGGIGNDTLRGQGGIDVADYSDLTFNGVFGTVAGLDVNLNHNIALHSSNNNALTWTDTLTTIENVIGTSRNDRFIGDENDNVFYGLGEVGRDDRQTEFMGLNGESYKVTGDVVEYDGDRHDFTFGVSSEPYFGGITVTGDGIGTDILLGIEFLKFDDGLIAASDIDI